MKEGGREGGERRGGKVGTLFDTTSEKEKTKKGGHLLAQVMHTLPPSLPPPLPPFLPAYLYRPCTWLSSCKNRPWRSRGRPGGPCRNSCALDPSKHYGRSDDPRRSEGGREGGREGGGGKRVRTGTTDDLKEWKIK